MLNRSIFLTDVLDYYKLTMSQFQFFYSPHVITEFRFQNRGSEDLSIPFDELKDSVAYYQNLEFTKDELAFLEGQGFKAEYLEALTTLSLPDVKIENGEIITNGIWWQTTFWETIILSEVQRIYVDKQNLDLEAEMAKGSDFIKGVKQFLIQNPDFKLGEMGLRRRFSSEFQDLLVSEIKDQIIGTSNVHLAIKYGVPALGTYAHEMPMVYTALDPVNGEETFLNNWQDFYGDELSVTLPDTYTTKAYFEKIPFGTWSKFKTFRIDSGDPIEAGEFILNIFKENKLDPQTKTLLFSDSLTMEKSKRIFNHFKDRINLVFGIGTHLTNSFSCMAPINIVMKASEANGIKTFKITDSKGKRFN